INCYNNVLLSALSSAREAYKQLVYAMTGLEEVNTKDVIHALLVNKQKEQNKGTLISKLDNPFYHLVPNLNNERTYLLLILNTDFNPDNKHKIPVCLFLILKKVLNSYKCFKFKKKI